MAGKPTLEDLRSEIAEVTSEIFRLCGERIRLAKKIAEIKAREKMPIEDLKVEEEQRKRVLDLCHGRGIDRSFCARLLELLLDESKRIQRETLKPES